MTSPSFEKVQIRQLLSIASAPGVDRTVSLICHSLARMDRFGTALFESGELGRLVGAHWKRSLDKATAWGFVLAGSTSRAVKINPAAARQLLPAVLLDTAEHSGAIYVGVLKSSESLAIMASAKGAPLWWCVSWWTFANAVGAENDARYAKTSRAQLLRLFGTTKSGQRSGKATISRAISDAIAFGALTNESTAGRLGVPAVHAGARPANMTERIENERIKAELSDVMAF